MALRQILTHKLDIKLSPMQIQLMRLLEVPTMEMDQRIKREIEENPALEEGLEEIDEDKDEEEGFDDDENEFEDDFDAGQYLDEDTPDYKTKANNYSKDDEERSIPLSVEISFQDKLIEQLHLLDLDETQFIIADTIIGNLDESGYLNREIEAIVDDLAFSMNLSVTEKEVLSVLKMVQDLDPAGIAARDLKECLLLQIKRKQEGSITLFTAKKILEDHFEEFTKKHYDKIIKKLEIEESDLKDAIDAIIRLNPKPGGSLKDSAKSIQHVIPDFLVSEFEGKLELSINGRNTPDLHVSKDYEVLLKNYSEGAKSSKQDQDALVFVKNKLEGAKWFIEMLRQRQMTLYSVMHTIMSYQKEYFLTGDEGKLKPMILKDIAEIVEMDVSTISRVANSKFVQTAYGVFPLRHFFSESMSTDSGEEVSTREVKQILTDAIDGESKRKPLTDEELMGILNDKGYNIARRTIAKYREGLNIPVARLRKQL
jgi:RNA polymerase sigma-54 factor